MNLQEFKEKYSVDQVKVLDALIEQVKQCTTHDLGYLSDVLRPKGMTNKVFDKIVKEFKEWGYIYYKITGMSDGYSINNTIIEGCFDVSKETEIALLKTLIDANGYFSEFFKSDFEQMQSNIKNDFPIQFDTKFHSVVETQMKRGDDLIKKHCEERYSLYETMLCVASETNNERLYERVVDDIGRDSVIKLKRLLGLDIDSKEIDYLVAKLDVDFK